MEQSRFDVRLDARSGSFAGSVESAWFAEDLIALRAAIVGVAAAADRVVSVVRGNRTAELRLAGGATAGEEQWITAWLTPNGRGGPPRRAGRAPAGLVTNCPPL